MVLMVQDSPLPGVLQVRVEVSSLPIFVLRQGLWSGGTPLCC